MLEERKEIFRVNRESREFYFCPEGKQETVFKKFYTYESVYNFAEAMLLRYREGFIQTKETMHPKNIYKDFFNLFGVTASVAYRHHTSISLSIWVDPFKNLLDGIAYNNKRKAEGYIVTRVWENEPIVREVLADGLDNIASLVAVLGKTPAELRMVFGKSLWRKLSNNSKSRNYLICKMILSQERYNPRESDEERLGNIKDNLLFLSTLPSGVLRVVDYFSLDEFKYAYDKILRGRSVREQVGTLRGSVAYCNILGDLRSLVDIFKDTKRMSGMLNLPFNPEWSEKTLKNKHDEYMSIYEEGRFSKEPFSCVEKLQGKETFNSKGVVAKLIKSAYDLNVEGREMKHCVSSYSNLVGEGQYIVYSIISKEQRSTLGIRVTTNLGIPEVKVLSPKDQRSTEEIEVTTRWNVLYSKDQIYGSCNSQVTCKDTLDMVELILSELNGG